MTTTSWIDYEIQEFQPPAGLQSIDHLPSSEVVEVAGSHSPVAFTDDRVWSIYGTERAQPVATGRKSDGSETGPQHAVG
jgi:hypothetical protein